MVSRSFKFYLKRLWSSEYSELCVEYQSSINIYVTSDEIAQYSIFLGDELRWCQYIKQTLYSNSVEDANTLMIMGLL